MPAGDTEGTTAAPPNVRLLSFASLSCTVIVVVLVPFATMLAAVGVMVERAGENDCATVTLTSLVTPPDVARTVAGPFATAVATPVTGSMERKAAPTGTDQ